MRRVGRRGSDEANGAESPSHGAAIRELVKALLPGKAEWPNGSWQAVTVLLASIALMFRTELGANIFGLSLILASGSFWVGICLTQSDAVKTHVRYRVIASLILSSAAFSFANMETVIHVISSREEHAAQAKRRASRERLGVFLSEAQMLMDKVVEATKSTPMKAPPQAEADAWAANIRAYLRQNLDESFVQRFDNPPYVNLSPIYAHQLHNAIYQWVQDRKEQLRLFISELKD